MWRPSSPYTSARDLPAASARHSCVQPLPRLAFWPGGRHEKITWRESGNQSGVQQSTVLTALTAPLATSMRAMLQPVPKEFATPISHLPSGDHVSCWKNPWRGNVRSTLPVSASTNDTPLRLNVANSRPLGLHLAHGSSTSVPTTRSPVQSLFAATSAPCSP